MNNMKLIEPGKWYNEFDDEGRFKGAGYDASYYRILGYRPGELEMGRFEDWLDRIHPDDRERVLRYSTDVCSKHPEGMDYDTEFRMMTRWGYHWFHDYGHCTRREDGSVIRCDGVVFDVQDIVEKRDAHRLLTENYTRILALEDNFELLYDVELDTGRYEVFSKGQTFGDMNEKLISSNDFFDDVERNLNVVHPDDRQGNYDTTRPEAIRRALAESDRFDRYYRLMVNGQPVWARMRIVYKDAGKKNIIIGVFSAENDVEAKQIAEQKKQLEVQQKQLKDQLALSDGLAREYHTVWLVESTGEHKMHLYRSTGKTTIRNALQMGLDDPSYDAGIVKYVHEYVHEDDRARVLEATKLETVMRETPEVGTYAVSYRRYNPEHTAYDYHQMVYARAQSEDGKLNYVLAYRDADRMIREQMEKQARFEKSSRIISALSEDFGCVMYVELADDKADDVSTNYRVSQLLKKTIPGWEKETGFGKKMRLLLDHAVYDHDREKFLQMTGRAAVLEKLQDNDVYFADFRVLVEDEVRYYQMKFSAVRENGELIGVVAGLHSVHERMKRELESRRKEKEAEDAAKLIESVAGSYRFAFAMNMTGPSFRVIRMDEDVKRLLNVDDFKTYGEAVAPLMGLLHPADRERMTRELDMGVIRRKLADVSSYKVEYRVMVKGAAQWHEMNVTRIAGEEIAMGFGEKDLEITRKHIEEVRYKEYFGLYEADIDTGMYKVIIDSPYYTFSETGDPVPYCDAMRTFAENQIGETKEYFLHLADLNWVKNTLAADDRHSFTYYSVTAGNTWVDVTCYVTMRHEDGTPAMFALAFSFISSAGAAHQEMQKRLNESNQIISGLASSFMALYYLNMDEDIFNVYSLDGAKYPQTHKIVSAGGDPFEMLRSFGTSDIVHPDDRHFFAEMSKEMFRRRLADQKHFSIRFRRRDGDTYIWNEMDVVKYEELAERANAVVVGFTDCDEEIRKELKQQEDMETALSLAEVANRAKTDFLFNMSHDIRTPMNAIIGFTNMAKKEINDPEKALDCLDKVRLSSDILLSLINDVLDMSRIESGKAKLNEERWNFDQVFDNIEPAMANLAASKDIDLRFSIGDIRDRFVIADGPRFDRVLINIVSNAIKYTPGNGFVRVFAEQIPGSREGFGDYRITVADSGIGMSEEFQKRMYDDFSREENSTVSGIQGTGLGLSLAKKLVDMMGGTITCESRQGIGTTFILMFPFRLQTAEEIAESAAAVQESAQIELKGRKVLLVEDNALNRDIAEDILSGEGMTVETACDGLEAVNTVRERGSGFYDFILMDIQMPGMDGYEATRTIHRLMPELNTPIIALSANAFAEDRAKSIEAGMVDHVAKPINVKELMAVLAKYL